MEKITSIKVMPISKVFDNTHMMITLPINEKAMTAEMLEIKYRAVDRWINTENYGGFKGYEAFLGIDVFTDGTKFFTLTFDVYFNNEEPPDTTVEMLDLSPEMADYYYNMAIRQLAENLRRYGK